MIALEPMDCIFGMGLLFFGKTFLLIAHGALDRSWFASDLLIQGLAACQKAPASKLAL